MTGFSIVTINWNNLEGLKTTYESVVAQTYRNFRWIVVDGASSDGSQEWLAGLDEPRAEITSERDKGIYDAMNKGLRKAVETPGYTLFLNSGDAFADPQVLERIVAAIEAAAVPPRFIYGDFYRKAANGSLTRIAAKPIERLPLGLPASHQTMYFENERLREMHFRENYRLSADYCMLIEFLTGMDRSTAVLQLPFPLCVFDTTGISHKRRFEALKEDMQIRMRFLQLPWVNAVTLYCLHYVHTHTKQLKAALGK